MNLFRIFLLLLLFLYFSFVCVFFPPNLKVNLHEYLCIRIGHYNNCKYNYFCKDTNPRGEMFCYFFLSGLLWLWHYHFQLLFYLLFLLSIQFYCTTGATHMTICEKLLMFCCILVKKNYIHFLFFYNFTNHSWVINVDVNNRDVDSTGASWL